MTERDNQVDHPSASRLPLVYVPRGKVALKEAVIRLGERRNPSLPIRQYLQPPYAMLSDPLRTLPAKTDPYVWPIGEKDWGEGDLTARERVYSYISLQRSREDLRAALAEGEIQALGMNHLGELAVIGSEYWRTDAGGNRLVFTDQQDKYAQVYFSEQVLSDWLGTLSESPVTQIPARTTMRAEQQTRAWLTQVLARPQTEDGSRNDYREQAMALFAVSAIGFKRMWDEVTKSDPGLDRFRKPGRKPAKKIGEG